MVIESENNGVQKIMSGEMIIIFKWNLFRILKSIYNDVC